MGLSDFIISLNKNLSESLERVPHQYKWIAFNKLISKIFSLISLKITQ